MGFEEAQDFSTKHSLVFPHGIGVELGFTVRVFALAGSIFTGATGSIVFWTKGDTVKRACLPPRAGGQNYSHARTTRLHYNLLYIPHVTVYVDRSDLLNWELMYDTLYPRKRVGGLRRYARYRTFLTSWQSLKDKAINWHFKEQITGPST